MVPVDDVTAYFARKGNLVPGHSPPSQPQIVRDCYYLGCYGDDTVAEALSGEVPAWDHPRHWRLAQLSVLGIRISVQIIAINVTVEAQ